MASRLRRRHVNLARGNQQGPAITIYRGRRFPDRRSAAKRPAPSDQRVRAPPPPPGPILEERCASLLDRRGCRVRSPIAAALSLLALPIACASPPPPARALPATPLVSASAAPSASAPPSPGLASPAAAPPLPKRRFLVEDHPLPDDLDADAGPAPCDFERSCGGDRSIAPARRRQRRRLDFTGPTKKATHTRSDPRKSTVEIRPKLKAQALTKSNSTPAWSVRRGLGSFESRPR